VLEKPGSKKVSSHLRRTGPRERGKKVLGKMVHLGKKDFGKLTYGNILKPNALSRSGYEIIIR